MANMRELKGRINSVHSSRKITGAMKMISSARLRKAENKLLQAMPYRQRVWEIYARIQKSGCEFTSPLSEQRETRRLAVVVFASDEGLCGAFNMNLLKKFKEVIRRYQADGVSGITVFAVGKKILPDLRKTGGVRLAEMPEAFQEKKDMPATRELADRLMGDFLAGRYDRVEVVYAHYKSVGTQIFRSHQFLPVVPDKAGEMTSLPEKDAWYLYEPDCESVLKMLYPLMLHALMYEMLMESRTSEEAARILAMQMANDNAEKLLGDLQLEYNKLRQQGITTELLDIAGGSSRGN